MIVQPEVNTRESLTIAVTRLIPATGLKQCQIELKNLYQTAQINNKGNGIQLQETMSKTIGRAHNFK
jgi:hypothetical protein